MTRRTTIHLVTLLLGMATLVLALTPRTHAIAGGAEPDPVDRRFDAIAAFSFTAWLNGEVFEHNTFCNGTLISPTEVLMAYHCVGQYNQNFQPPSGLYSFRFRRNTDGSLGTKAAGWQSFHHVAITHFTFPDTHADVVIAHLAEPVTHIKPIPIADPATIKPGDDLLLAAWGTESNGSRGRLTVARTRIDEVSEKFVRFPGAADPDNPCDCGPLIYDSGGAALIELDPRVQPDDNAKSVDTRKRPRLALVGSISTTIHATLATLHQDVEPVE